MLYDSPATLFLGKGRFGAMFSEGIDKEHRVVNEISAWMNTSRGCDEETNINWPLEWTVDYGKGRVYNSSMGHLWKGDFYPVSLRCLGFQTILIRATESLGNGKTSYAVSEDFPSESDVRMVEGK